MACSQFPGPKLVHVSLTCPLCGNGLIAPPVQLIYGMSMDVADIHSARFGKALKDKMDPLGIRCEVYAGQDVLGGGERISTIDFIKEAFGM